MGIIEQYTDSNVSVIILNNSDAGNVLNIDSLTLLQQALKQAAENKETRLILIRSNGNNFCLGMDLHLLVNLDDISSNAEKAVSCYIEILNLMYTTDKPVLCLVNGAVKAGGIGLMSAADIIIASAVSSFELSEVLFGMIPANVLPYIFSLRLSPQKVRYLIMTAKKIMADEAKQIGLIDESFPAEQLEKETKAIIKNILRAAPAAITELKKFTCKINRDKINSISSIAKETILRLVKDPEVKKAICCFQEGNVPEWFLKYKPERSLVE